MASDEELAARLQSMMGGSRDTDLAARVQERVTQSRPAVSSALRGVVRGATMGTNDEIKGAIAGVGGLFTGEGFSPAYARGRDAERALDAADDAANPALSTVGQVYGGIGGAVGGGAAAGAVGLTSGLARLAAPVASRVNALLPSWLTGAGRVLGTGAAGGGAAGFGEGQGGFGERLENAGQGAAIGAAAGGVIGAGVRVGAGVGGRIGHAFGLRNPDVAADRHVLRAMDRSGVDVDQAAAQLAAGGDAPLALVDVGGRNTVNLGRVAANTPGEAVEAADQFVQMRRGTRPDRLMNAGDEAFGGGSGADIARTVDELQTQRSTQAAPLYEQAFGRPTGVTEPLEIILEDPTTRAGLARGLDIQRREARTAGTRPDADTGMDPAIRFDEDGTPRIVGEPSTRTLDAVKRGLDDILEEYRDRGTGRLQLDERGRGIDRMRARYVELMDQGNPDYAAARAAWAGPSQALDAVDRGRQAFRTDRDVVTRNAEGGNADFYRLGAGRDFADRVSDPARASGAARQMLEDHQMQARLNALLPPEARGRFSDVLRRETDMTAVERAVSPRAGSQTGALLAGGDDLGRDPMGPMGTALLQLTSGSPLAAGATVARDVWRRAGQGINPATSDALANRLFATDPAARAAVLEALRNRRVNDLMRVQQGRATLRPVLQGVGAGAGLTAD